MLFSLVFIGAGTGCGAESELATAIERPILAEGEPLRELQSYIDDRIARIPGIESQSEHEAWASDLRSEIFDRVVLRGEASSWRKAERKIEWLDAIDAGPGYRIRKLRFEAVPGLWVPALLYEPLELEGRVPVVLNVNGHDGDGKAARYKQIRCINQAKRGMLALNVEWLGMGQLRSSGFAHTRMNQLDLCGTSGLAPFYLSLERSLDILLAHEHADPARVAVAGLSGGGWQTITISALDERVTLANPVAGYGSFRERVKFAADLGDSEQTPVDLASLADYTHLTALVAPRSLLLTYNASDDCCFRAEHTLPPLLDAVQPIYRIFDRASHLRSHVNEDPGTHNFERENREVLYRALGDWFFPGSEEYSGKEIPSDDEIRSSDDLAVPLPEPNADFHRLALGLARSLPVGKGLPTRRDAALSWQTEHRGKLAAIVQSKTWDARLEQVDAAVIENGPKVTRLRLRLGSDWTVPVVEIAAEPAKDKEPLETTVIVTDDGRSGAIPLVEEELARGVRVAVVDPLSFGESKVPRRDWLWSLLLSSVGDRPLGIQASQVVATCKALGARGSGRGAAISLRAKGPRSSLIALVAAALDSESIKSVILEESFVSLVEIIEKDWTAESAPELFCFGLLRELDIVEIAALVAPRPIEFRSQSARSSEALAPLVEWQQELGGEGDIFKTGKGDHP